MTFGIRYFALLGSVMLGFTGFVACGTQFYKVPLTEDHEAKSIPESATDPASPSFGLHAPDGWKQLPIHFKTGMALNVEQKEGLTRAMKTWEMAVGKKLFHYEGEHSGITGDTFKDLYSSLGDHVNGHYLDDTWSKTGKPTVVLATTIWDNDPDDARAIATADIRFNSNYYNIGDSFRDLASDEREVVDMQTLATHELGHLLGLAHMSAQVDSFSIMTPSLYIGEGLANRRLSRGDIERIQKIYGCSDTACDVDETLAKIEMEDRKQRSKDEKKGGKSGAPQTAETARY